jgi:hypothetical protein
VRLVGERTPFRIDDLLPENRTDLGITAGIESGGGHRNENQFDIKTAPLKVNTLLKVHSLTRHRPAKHLRKFAVIRVRKIAIWHPSPHSSP